MREPNPVLVDGGADDLVIDLRDTGDDPALEGSAATVVLDLTDEFAGGDAMQGRIVLTLAGHTIRFDLDERVVAGGFKGHRYVIDLDRVECVVEDSQGRSLGRLSGVRIEGSDEASDKRVLEALELAGARTREMAARAHSVDDLRRLQPATREGSGQ